MKTYILFIATAFLFVACQNDPRAKLPQTGLFGQSINENTEVIAPEDANSKINEQVIVSGVVDEYCKGDGCWLTLKNSNGESLFVEVSDKSFVLPHNINGKNVLAEGVLQSDSSEQSHGSVKLMATGIVIK